MFMFYIFLVLSCGGFAPRFFVDFCKPCFFLIFIYSYLFFFIYSNLLIYIYICMYIYMYMYIYIYVCIYIYMCIYMIIYICVCVCKFMYYIYKCVWGGGCLKMRCPFFLSKNPFRNQKKTPRFETYPCIYNILFF